MNAVSIRREPASTLCETPEKTGIFQIGPSRTGRWKDGKTVEKKADAGKREMDRCGGCERTARSLFELTSLVIEILCLATQLARCLTQLD